MIKRSIHQEDTIIKYMHQTYETNIVRTEGRNRSRVIVRNFSTPHSHIQQWIEQSEDQ